MKRKELLALDKLHPLVAILTKALEFKDRQQASLLGGGTRLAASLLERAIAAHSSQETSPYPYLLVMPFSIMQSLSEQYSVVLVNLPFRRDLPCMEWQLFQAFSSFPLRSQISNTLRYAELYI